MPASFFNEKSHWISDVEQTGDGHYIIPVNFLEVLYPKTKPKIRGGVVKLDYQGKTVWKTKFKTRSNKYKFGDRARDERTDCMDIDDVYECANGDILTCGIVEHRKYGEYVRVLFLARMNSNGKILWEKRFDDIAISRYRSKKPNVYESGMIDLKLQIAETSSGKIIVGGFVPNYKDDWNNCGYQVLRFSDQGKLLNKWEDEYIKLYYSNSALLEKEDGAMEFVFCYRGDGYIPRMRVLRMENESTAPKRKFDIEIGFKDGRHKLQQVIADQEGNYVGVGSYQVSSGRSKHKNLLIMKLDPSGKQIFGEGYDFIGKNDEMTSLCLSPNNDIVVGGYAQIDKNYAGRSLFFGTFDQQGKPTGTHHFDNRKKKDGNLFGGPSKIIPSVWGGYLMVGDYFVTYDSPQRTGLLSLDEKGMVDNYLKLFEEKAFTNIDQVIAFVKDYPEHKTEAERLAGPLATSYEDFGKYIATFSSGAYYDEINKAYRDYQYIEDNISLLDHNVWAARGDRGVWNDFIEDNRNIVTGGDRYNIFISGVVQNKGDRKMRVRILNLFRTVSTSSSGVWLFRTNSIKENEYERNYILDLEPGDIKPFAVVYRNQSGDSGYKVGYFSSYFFNRLDEDPFETIIHPFYGEITPKIKEDQQYVYEAAVIGNLKVTQSDKDKMKEWVDGIMGRMGLDASNDTRLCLYLEKPDHEVKVTILEDNQTVELKTGVKGMRADFLLPPGKEYTVQIPGVGDFKVLVKDRLTHLVVEKDKTTRVVYDN